jgi:hypothetical protein
MLRWIRLDVGALVVAGVVLLVPRGHAEAPMAPSSSAHPTDGPCAAALARFCKDVPAGEGRLRACLMAHEKELPADCRARIGRQAGGARRREAPMGPRELRACRTDLEVHCAGIASGGGRWLACLRQHEAAITPGCRAAIARPAGAPTSSAAGRTR